MKPADLSKPNLSFQLSCPIFQNQNYSQSKLKADTQK